ncbi:MAG: hypothetical protein NZ941_01580 [Candidatus Caldarchaeum sp.]|nr:hypothetical protein [Candidatus Caldarchaeum sp.]
MELHLLGERETRILRKEDHFELHHLLLASTRPNDNTWIEEAVEKAKPVLNLPVGPYRFSWISYVSCRITCKR